MKFKTTALCVGATLASITPALAQQGSNVTIYGVLDLGYEYVNHVGTADDHASRVSQGKGTSYWGLRGREDLGGGLRAIFNLESGFAADTGVLGHGGRLFGRQSYVGLEGGFGRISLGRQYTMKWWATRMGNTFGTGAHGLTSLDEGISNPRQDNAILYLSPKIKGFQAGASYSFGRGVANSAAGNAATAVAVNCAESTSGDSKQCRSISAMGSYDNDNWGAALGYEGNYGGPGAYGGLTDKDLSDKRYIMTGFFKVGSSRFGLGVLRRHNEGTANFGHTYAGTGLTIPQNTKSNLVWLTGSVPVTANISIDGIVGQIKYNGSHDKARLLTLRPVYTLSKRSQLYVSANYVKNSGDVNFSATTATGNVPPKLGGSQLSVIAGMSHGF
jgi:predicted porin